MSPGCATTAGCPALDKPGRVLGRRWSTRLEAAGYVPVAKTNIDQFATGLVGTRSPYGACASRTRPDPDQRRQQQRQRRRGGVRHRPAGAGHRHRRLRAGTGGLQRARRSQTDPGPAADPRCLSRVPLARLRHHPHPHRAKRLARPLRAMAGFDPLDPWSRASAGHLPPGIAAALRDGWESRITPDRPRSGLPHRLRGICAEGARSRTAGRARRRQPLPGRRADCFTPDRGSPSATPPSDVCSSRTVRTSIPPSVRSCCLDGRSTPATAFDAFEALARLRRLSEAAWNDVDALLLPVTPDHPTLAEVAADPLGVNSRLGTFTNFVNLLDLCAVAVPGSDTSGGSARSGCSSSRRRSPTTPCSTSPRGGWVKRRSRSRAKPATDADRARRCAPERAAAERSRVRPRWTAASTGAYRLGLPHDAGARPRSPTARDSSRARVRRRFRGRDLGAPASDARLARRRTHAPAALRPASTGRRHDGA